MPGAEFGLNISDEDPEPLLQALVGYIGGHYAEHLGYIDQILHGSEVSRRS
jgi:hypothetical protein